MVTDDKEKAYILSDKQEDNKYNTINEEDNLTLILKTQQKFTDDIPILDQIFNNYGYGPITWKFIIFTFLVMTINGLEMTLLASLLIPIQDYYSFTDVLTQFNSSIIFVAFGVGSFVVGYLTNKFSRSLILKISLSIILVSHILMSLVSVIALFTIFRIIIGLFVGIIVPISLNLLTEHLPIELRSATLNLVWIGYSVGQVGLLVIALIVMPNFETTNLKHTLLISSIFPIIALVIHLFLLEDSPRHLLIQGENKKAFEILEIINKQPLTSETRDKILHQVHSGVNEHLETKLKDIFHGKYLKMTILLLFIWMLTSMLLYGPMLISTLTQKQLGQSQNTSNRDIIIGQIVIHSISSLSRVLGGFLSETNFGRIKTIALGCGLAVVFLIVLMIIPIQFTLFYGLVMMVISVSYTVNASYSNEVYPTKLRDLAIGVLFTSNKVGGFISQIIYIPLNNWYIWAPYIFTAVIAVISVF